MIVRDATAEDLPQILAIYNDVIANTTAVWTEEPATLEDRQAWFAGRKAAGYPILVASEGGSVSGFASFGDFRAWPGYRYTVEHSIHVRDGERRRGVGSALLPALIERAAKLNKHMMIAGIEGENTGSILLHKRFGFLEAGRLFQVGHKFNRFIDLLLLQRGL
ncbi:MAG TPA: GNAT family N-acetyltransferase [Myxococcales bacterium]|jgi:phosphinothricin acetyltransferase|nr:GNAT family N-acetyltransferase [Myxococcales bacterium]